MSCTNEAGATCPLSMNDCNKRKYPYDQTFAKKYYKDDESTEGLAAALYYPYNTEVLQPKWPDGMSQFSEGVKRFYNKEIVFPEDNIIIAIVPGLCNFLVFYKYNKTETRYEIFDGGDLSNYLNLTVVKQNYLVQKEPIYSSWRPVSFALNLWRTNAEGKPDGWFDCIRINNSKLDTNMAVQFTTKTDINSNLGNVAIYHEKVKERYNNPNKRHVPRNMVNNPTYYIGTFSELPDYVFQLNPEKKENEFLPLKPVSGKTSTNGMVESQGYYSDQMNPVNEADGKAIIKNRDTLVADSHDIIIIRLFGTKDDTRFLIQGTGNIEFLPTENSPKYNAVTPNTPAMETLTRYIDNRSRFHKLPFHLTTKPGAKKYY